STSEIARASARRSPSSRRWAREGSSFASAIGGAIIAGQYDSSAMELLADAPATDMSEGIAAVLRRAPEPLHGGPLALLRFMRANHMLDHRYARLIARWLWLKLRYRGR